MSDEYDKFKKEFTVKSPAEPETEDEKNFMRFFKFGTVDGSILMMSILAGFSLEGTISRRIGAKGYGPILGAGLGNAFADTVAGIPEGKWAAIGVGAGALLPLFPIFGAMALRREFIGNTVKVAGGSSAVLFVATYMSSFWPKANKQQS